MLKLSVPICNRTNYSKLKSILAYLKKNSKIDISIVLSSDMAIDKPSNAIADILSDGLSVSEKIDCLMKNDTLESMSKTMAISLIEHVTYFIKEKPNAVLIVGDRFDILPSVLSAKMLNLPILHLQGGERSGSIDDTIRDIITICADRHYVATEEAYNYVKMIAKSKNVFNFGCPAVEVVSQIPVGDYLDVSLFKKKYKNSFGISPNEKYLLVVVHPNTQDENDVDMDAILGACISFGLKMVVVYPNIDPYNSKILKGMKDYEEDIICVRHMPLEDFVPMMAHASCMIGNSSAGIREAASFGTPVVNIGNRQKGRERNKNVIDCLNSYEDIKKAISLSLEKGKYPIDNLYYKENTSINIGNDIIKFLESNYSSE